MRYELKSIPIWPIVKVFFLINIIAGFIFGLLLAIVSSGLISFYNEILQVSNPGYNVELIPLEVLIFMMPLLFALGNAIFTTTLMIIIIFIYNLLVKFTGGIELNLSEIDIKVYPEKEKTLREDLAQIIENDAPPPPPKVIEDDNPPESKDNQ
jgi:hypothetical protein